MASTGYIYLDIDDEITSAAARIRAADEARVAIVLPAGSRLATSRINFRLLAREAQGRSRQLIVVAPEAATRALAASAGLGAYASVRDLEADLDPEGAALRFGDGTIGQRPASDPAGVEAEYATGEGAAGNVAAGAMAVGAASAGAAAGAAAASAAAGATPAGPDATPDAGATRARPRGRASSIRETSTREAESAFDETAVRPAVIARDRAGAARLRDQAYPRDADLPVVAKRRSGERRTGLIVGLAVVVLLFVAGGVLGFVFLPSATIVVTPKVEQLGPLSIAVKADPNVTAPDPASFLVPATVATFPLEVTQDFDATGTKVSETKAHGAVTFTSKNTADSVTIPAGTQVSTRSGIVFVTTADVTVPKAEFGPPSKPGTADAPIRATDGGTGGNVGAGTIVHVSTQIEAALVNGDDPVNNENPTSGGTHKETTVVDPKDITKATATLTKQLASDLSNFVANPGSVLPDMTVFPDTKTISTPTPTVDKATLIGKAMERFSYGLSATGSVTAVDESAVRTVAEQRLRSSVLPDHDIVAGSVAVVVGRGTIDGNRISFPVRATGSQVRRVDSKQLRDLVKGKRVADARALLEPYGNVSIDTWPGFVTTIPTYDFRLSVTVNPTAQVEGANPTDELPTTSEGPAASGGEPTDESGGSENESPSPAGSTAGPSNTSP